MALPTQIWLGLTHRTTSKNAWSSADIVGRICTTPWGWMAERTRSSNARDEQPRQPKLQVGYDDMIVVRRKRENTAQFYRLLEQEGPL